MMEMCEQFRSLRNFKYLLQNSSWFRTPKPIYGGRVTSLFFISQIDSFDKDTSVITHYFLVWLCVIMRLQF